MRETQWGKKSTSELEGLSAKNSDISERHDGSNEQSKAKKKKHMVPEICDEIAEPRGTGNPNEIVKTNKVKPVALENNSLESNLKEKTEKKKGKKVKCTDPATADLLDVNVSTHDFKKKKLKLDSDVVPKMISGQTEEEKSSDNVKEMEINHDVGASDFEHQNVLVFEDRETKGTKKVSQKRKMLDSEKADGNIANKKSKVDLKVNEEKAKTGETVESSRSIMDINTPVPKTRNTGENRKNTENAGEQLQRSTKSNENGNTHNSKNVGKQLENGSIGKKDSVSVAEGQLCMEIVLLIEAAFYCLPFHGLVALH